MASKAVKWLMGCGLGCGGLIVIVIALTAFGSASLVKNTTRGFEEALEERAQLQERFGDSASFVPEADGTIPRERVEAFLSVREAMRPAREGVEVFFRSIPTTREAAEELEAQPTFKKLGSILGITKSAFGLGADLGDLFGTRNKQLAEVGMSLGEYTYLYTLIYDSWLGHSIASGPEMDGVGEVDFGGGKVADRVLDELREMLQGQLESIPAETDDPAWREILAAEVARLDADYDSVPWANGLPERIVGPLEPYRAQFEGSYSEFTNAFELGRARKRGRFSYDVE